MSADDNAPDTVDQGPDNPGVVAHPPVLYLAGLAAGFMIDLVWPLPFLSTTRQFALGGGFLGFGVLVIALGVVGFAKAGTNVPTNRPATALVTTGVHRFSRNPIYIALTAIAFGVAFMVDSIWMVVSMLPVFVVMNVGVVAREERYLEAKFGDDYRAYKKRVRRWL